MGKNRVKLGRKMEAKGEKRGTMRGVWSNGGNGDTEVKWKENRENGK